LNGTLAPNPAATVSKAHVHFLGCACGPHCATFVAESG